MLDEVAVPARGEGVAGSAQTVHHCSGWTVKLQTQLRHWSAGDTIQRDNLLSTIILLNFASNELVQVRSTLKYATEMISRCGRWKRSRC